MKLLFDHNLSHKLVRRLADIFPDSTQTRLLNFSTANDSIVWQYAKENDFVIVTLDKDFSELALQRGMPSKIIWLRCGNSTVAEIERSISQRLKSLKDIWKQRFWKFGREAKEQFTFLLQSCLQSLTFVSKF